MTIDRKFYSKVTRKTLTGNNAKIYVGNKLVGTINNIDWGDAVFNGGCSCGSTAGKFKPGHKPGCAWWIFADQYQKQYAKEHEKTYVMGRFEHEEIVHLPRTLSSRGNLGMCGEDMGDNLGYGEGKPVNCDKCNEAVVNEGYELHYTGVNYVEELVADIKKLETTKVHSDNLKSLLKAFRSW